MQIDPALTNVPRTVLADASGSVPNADFQTFLRMLTTQLQNQDPLNPMASSDFSVQLATFSGVEQQTRTNQYLGDLSAQMGQMAMGQLSGWIGLEARVASPVSFRGAPITIFPVSHPEADISSLIVRDSQNRVISKTPLESGTARIEWAGTTDTGAPLPAGVYGFEVESYSNGELLASTVAEAYAVIREARREGGGAVTLGLDGGVNVAAANVSALRGGQ